MFEKQNVVSQDQIDDEVNRLGFMAHCVDGPFRSCIDAQILTLADRLQLDAISARWGGSNCCHDSAVAAHEWLEGRSAEAPSIAWGGYRLATVVL